MRYRKETCKSYRGRENEGQHQTYVGIFVGIYKKVERYIKNI